MTAQITDSIMINDDVHMMYGWPLEQYWDRHNNKPPLYGSNTAMYRRGYYAKWSIEDARLYLIDFYGSTMNMETIYPLVELSLHDLFPGAGKVFAEWYTGDIQIPMGNQIDYVHYGYGRSYIRVLHDCTRGEWSSS